MLMDNLVYFVLRTDNAQFAANVCIDTVDSGLWPLSVWLKRVGFYVGCPDIIQIEQGKLVVEIDLLL